MLALCALMDSGHDVFFTHDAGLPRHTHKHVKKSRFIVEAESLKLMQRLYFINTRS